MKIFVSSGEVSGDLHLSYLVQEMKKIDKDIKIYGVGGEHCKREGVEIIQSIDELAIMGFTEALKKYKFLKNKAYEYLEFIRKNEIKKVVLVDYGGFNLKFLELIKKELDDVEVYYYIPPKIWVWGKKRIEKLKLADHIMVIFPWEEKFYSDEGVKSIYFGNPFTEKYSLVEDRGDKILLLPGSRKQEVKKILPVMLEVVKRKTDENFVLKLAKKEHIKWVEEDLSRYKNLEIRDDITLEEGVKMSKVALGTSGTVILELCLLGIPGVVLYKASLINEIIVRLFIKLKYVSLPNLTVDKEVYPELLQRDCNSENLIKKLDEILDDEANFQREVLKIREELSGKDVVRSYGEYIIREEKNEKTDI